MVLILLLLTVNFIQVYAKTYEETAEFIVLFDEKHDQYFDKGRYEKALEVLNESGDFKINYNHKYEFSDERLEGVDILVIPNPEDDFKDNLTLTIGITGGSSSKHIDL